MLAGEARSGAPPTRHDFVGDKDRVEKFADAQQRDLFAMGFRKAVGDHPELLAGGAQGAQQLLQGQLASSLAPTLASAIQNAQQNTLGAQEFGVSTGLQQSLANAGAANNMTGLNLQNTMATNFANQGAANTAGTNLAQMLQQGWQVPLEAYSGLQSSALGSAGSLAGQEAQNFPVYQQQQPWYSTLFQAAGAAAPYAEMAAGG